MSEHTETVMEWAFGAERSDIQMVSVRIANELRFRRLVLAEVVEAADQEIERQQVRISVARNLIGSIDTVLPE